MLYQKGIKRLSCPALEEEVERQQEPDGRDQGPNQAKQREANNAALGAGVGACKAGTSEAKAG